jgi:hypothetical protein
MDIQTLPPKKFRGWIQELADQIKEKYDEGYSCREVGRQLNLNHCRVRNYLSHMGYGFSKSEGIVRSSKSRFDNVELSDKLLEIIEGNLLGDGSLTLQTNTAKPYLIPRSSVYAHDTKSLDQINWLKELLVENGLPMSDYIHFTKARSREIKSGVNAGSVANYKEKFGIKSLSQPSLKVLREKWYQPDKTIPKDLKLTPIKLLHWYLGDGTLGHDKYSYYPKLYTYSFSEEDVWFLHQRLKDDLGLKSYVRPRTSQPDHFRIDLSANKDDVIRFFQTIGPCPPELIADYGHKWPSA